MRNWHIRQKMINLTKYIFKLYSTKHKEKCKKSYVSRQNSEENTILQQTFFSTLRSTHFTAVPLCCCRFTLLHHNYVKKISSICEYFIPQPMITRTTTIRNFFFFVRLHNVCSLLWTLEWPPTTACFPGLCLVFVYLCLSVCLYLSICQFVHLFIYLSIFLSVWLSTYVYLSVCLYINISICVLPYLRLFICLSTYLFHCVILFIYLFIDVCHSIYLSVWLLTYWYVYLSNCLSLSLFIRIFNTRM